MIKDIPVTGRGGPEGCETSRLPHFLNNRFTSDDEVVSLKRFIYIETGVRILQCDRNIATYFSVPYITALDQLLVHFCS
jgi:hypothetical protein